MALSRTGSATPPLDVAYAYFNQITNNVKNFSVRKAAQIRAEGITRNELFLLVRYGKENLDNASIFATRATPVQLQAYVDIVSPEITDAVTDWQTFRDAFLSALDWIVTYSVSNPDASYTLTGGPYVSKSSIDNPQTYTDYVYTPPAGDTLTDFLRTHITSTDIELFAVELDALSLTIQD